MPTHTCQVIKNILARSFLYHNSHKLRHFADIVHIYKRFFVTLRAKPNNISINMKKALLLFCMAIGTYCGSFAQSQKTVKSEIQPTGQTKAENYAEIKFDTLRINLGKFPKSDPVRQCSFKFTNVGTAPLIINQAFPSCGCTIPSFTKEPIKPGEKGAIDVSYAGNGLPAGHFAKTISVRSNAKNQLVRLVIEGEMTED